MQVNVEVAGKVLGWDAPKIRNVACWWDTFLTVKEGVQSQSDAKIRLLLRRLGCIPRTTTDMPEVPGSLGVRKYK